MTQDTVHTAICPVSGCDREFERETPEEARNSTVAHVSGSTDDRHDGIGYAQAMTMLRTSDSIGSVEVDETGDKLGQIQPDSDEIDNPSSESRTESRFETPEPATDATRKSEKSQSENPAGTQPCPGCREPLPVEGVEPGYYNCSACGQRLRVTA